MRSSLLLASLLAVVPFLSASPTRPEPARRATPTFVSSFPTSNGTYIFADCFGDSETNRLLTHEVTPQGPFTVENCVDTCVNSNFVLGGVENGASCYCDNQISGDDTHIGDLDLCRAPCAGDSTEACGAFNLLLIYHPT